MRFFRKMQFCKKLSIEILRSIILKFILRYSKYILKFFFQTSVSQKYEVFEKNSEK